MKKHLIKTAKLLGFILLIPIIYFLIAILCSWITLEGKKTKTPIQNIYIQTNGVHLDLILPIEALDSQIKNQLVLEPVPQFVSLGWGDKNFYLNTPTWADLTAKNAFIALFLKSESLMHITEYQQIENDWIRIPVDAEQLNQLNHYFLKSFQMDNKDKFIHLPNKGYTEKDEFYKANGSYHVFNTCNSWVNSALKESELKASLWTPFDSFLLEKYQAEN